MFNRLSAAAAFLAAGNLVRGQGVGTNQAETHPSMTWQKCTAAGSCTSQSGKVVIDSNWRWVHTTGTTTNCYTGNTWNSSVCTSNTACASSCVLEGADYTATYGASASGNALSLTFVTKGTYATNIGSRLYLMASDTAYQMFTLLGNEFTFDVDLSQLPCGLNGALYFVSMDADGGMSKYSGNKAGAKYGTGYCDSQCPRDLKFINGQCNCVGWQPSSNDQNAGVGGSGSCCSEMDIWEANSMNSAVTPHPCQTSAQHSCSGSSCGGTYSGSGNRYNGDCDPDGCDYNPYRMGVTNFYGKGMTVDTSQKFTVVTQFIGSGTLTEIKQFFVQGGKTIQMPNSTWPTLTGYNSLTPAFCTAQKKEFGDTDSFSAKGGFTAFSKAVSTGMVLVMSLWDDHYANMLWLDSLYPTTADSSSPGKLRGSCSTSSGVPSDVESASASAKVVYSNIRFGPVGSTTTSS